MIYMCIYNNITKGIEFKEEYPNPRDISDRSAREQARLISEQNRARLYGECVGRNGVTLDEEGRYYITGPWMYYESTEKQFEFSS